MQPKMTLVDSENIHSIGWDSHRLYVLFMKGGLYEYKGVPLSIYKLLKDANEANFRIGDRQISINTLFHWLVKTHPTKYPYTEIKQTVLQFQQPKV